MGEWGWGGGGGDWGEGGWGEGLGGESGVGGKGGNDLLVALHNIVAHTFSATWGIEGGADDFSISSKALSRFSSTT